MSFTWAGRQLTSATVREKATSYTYNSDGIRTGKIVDGDSTAYFIDGSTIIAQRTGYDSLHKSDYKHTAQLITTNELPRLLMSHKLCF